MIKVYYGEYGEISGQINGELEWVGHHSPSRILQKSNLTADVKACCTNLLLVNVHSARYQV